MTQQATYTIKQFHELFHQYLMEKFEGDVREVKNIIDIAEDSFASMLNEYFGMGIGVIYDLQDENQIENLRRRIKAHPVLKNIDRRAEPRYTEVLRWYRLFLKSLKELSSPLPVPGEEIYDTSNPSGQKDSDFEPDTEGVENQFNLTKKERNPELRRKCIEYYKQQWGGRIHCICCGFDFSKAYGDIGEGFIEIHHRTPHHTYDGEHPVDPKTDLIPLCSNCHAMIHRVKGRGECMTLDQLINHFKGIKYNN